ncbi:MAG: general secretion pathway protein GspK [Armatimonadetes bacterium]|nr:general secretion pathway protein GspK [Armatimonadota bacterium]
MKRRGAVFVVTLAILAAMVTVLVAATVSAKARFQTLLSRTESESAAIAADAGVQRALAELSLLQAGQPATQQDDWYLLGQHGGEEFTLSGSSFRVEITDAGSKIDLNTATENQLSRMPLTQEQIDSLLDWREPGTAPRADGGKDEFYNQLESGYNAGLRRLDSFDALLSVKGFSPQALYQPQTDVVSTATIVQGTSDQQPTLDQLADVESYAPETTPTGATKLNINGAGANVNGLVQRGIPMQLAAQLFLRRPYARLGDVLAAVGANRQAQRAVLDELTISTTTRSEGKLNLNTASETVLNTLPALTPDIVQAILTRQQQGFAQLSDVLDVPGMSGNALTGSVDAFTVQSSAYRIRVEGRCGAARVFREVLVTVDNNAPKIAKVETPPFADMTARWNWPDEATQTTPVGGNR